MLKSTKDLVIDTLESEGGVFARKVWTRKNTKQLSIPHELSELHELKEGQVMELIINWKGKIYLTNQTDWTSEEDPIRELIGSYLSVETTLKRNRDTLYFTIPSKMYLSRSIRSGQPVILSTESRGLIRITPVRKEIIHAGQDQEN